ncbi:POC1 centriolar protein A [Ceratobasidium sp. UAMH 11750]|nr:POC1 centriolar protein A [Ceratobasidium sp. UAMH 11750]
MASPRRAGGNKLSRHRFQEIKLEPPTSKYDIIVEIRVDDKKVHELPEVKRGQPLCWSGLCLPCDVYETSTIAIVITEIHTLRNKRDSATYRVSQAKGQDTLSIECASKKYTVNLMFLDDKGAERAYRDAFKKAQEMGTQPSIIQRAGRTGDAFKTLLELGSAMAELDPTGSAKIAFIICAKAWMHLEEQDQQNRELNNLVEDLAGMIPSIDSIKRLADTDLRETAIAMLNLVEDVSLFILSSDSRRVRTPIGSFVSPGSNPQDQIESFSSNFKRLREEFDTRVSVQVLGTMQAENVRSRLKPVDLADYDATRSCLSNTRVAIIRDIITWTQEPNPEHRLAWVHGLAGLGKSSIATSVCQQLDRQGRLAASFFCRRDNPELRDPRRVLTTIAYSLSLRWKPYGEAVAAVVDKDAKLCSQHLQPLCDALLVKPLQVAAESNPPDSVFIVVVDALDECGSADTRKQLITCLHNISQTTSWLRVLATSRPDVGIQDCFAQPGADSFVRYNVLSYDALPDIRVFIRAQLDNVEHTIGDWPKDAIDKLSERSSGLFQWAQTACKFIAEGHNPRQRLEQVLAGTRLADSSVQLDALYTTAIKACAADDNLVYVRRCLGVVVATATRAPLSVPNLSKLLCGRIPQYTLDRVLHSLSSVLYFDHKDGDAVRISHPSFMDFITDRSRSKELWVDLDEQNAMLAECCLETMAKELRFNMCGLETSHKRNRDVPNLDKRVQDVIGAHLSYSCVYWTHHLVNSQWDMLQGPLRAFFFGEKLLYWIEALALLGKLNVAPSSLLELTRVSNFTDDFRAYAHDVYRFVLSFYDAISESTPHLYVSALALAPAKSKMAERIRSQFPNLLVVGKSGEQEWTSCLRTIWAQSEVNTTVFSPDGYRVASGSTDGTVRVWDAETGAALLEPLRGHSGPVHSVAFSPSGHRIVSGSVDRTVRIWDAETGLALLDPLRGHSGAVNSVAFSPDNRRIASGSNDMTVRVWDAERGTTIFESLRGHSGVALSVAFSLDGRRITSGSSDMNVRVWNADTGAALLRPLSGHLNHVYSVAFSPDGRRIVSGSRDKTIRVWDAETGAALLRGRRAHAGPVRARLERTNGCCTT